MMATEANPDYRAAVELAFEEKGEKVMSGQKEWYKIEDSDLRKFLIQTLNVNAQTVAQILRWQRQSGLIGLTGTTWRMNKDATPAQIIQQTAPVVTNGYHDNPPHAPVERSYPSEPNGKRVQIADFYRQRQGKMVEIIRGRHVYEDVFRIEYLEQGSETFKKMTTWVDPIIVIGERVELDPEQETYENVRKLRIIFTDGHIEDIDDLNWKLDVVTVAPRAG